MERGGWEERMGEGLRDKEAGQITGSARAASTQILAPAGEQNRAGCAARAEAVPRAWQQNGTPRRLGSVKARDAARTACVVALKRISRLLLLWSNSHTVQLAVQLYCERSS